MHDQVLIAWNDDTIVMAFRGTASMKNAMHDLQARFLSSDLLLLAVIPMLQGVVMPAASDKILCIKHFQGARFPFIACNFQSIQETLPLPLLHMEDTGNACCYQCMQRTMPLLLTFCVSDRRGRPITSPREGTGGWVGARGCIRASGAPGARTALQTVSLITWAACWLTARSPLQTNMSI